MDEEGRPILDWGHAIEALNKLDAGVPEQAPALFALCMTGRPEHPGGPTKTHCHALAASSALSKPCSVTCALSSAQICVGLRPHASSECSPQNTMVQSRVEVLAQTHADGHDMVVAQVLLLSRDEMSMLVVSYADIARCLKAAYGELQARSGAPR